MYLEYIMYCQMGTSLASRSEVPDRKAERKEEARRVQEQEEVVSGGHIQKSGDGKVGALFAYCPDVDDFGQIIHEIRRGAGPVACSCRDGQTKSKEAFPTISHDVETWIAYVPGEAHVQGLRIKRINGTTPDFPPVLQVSLPPQNHSIIFRQYPHAKLS
ncbi:hypothetical protein P167DRAFT_544182 [Morchella conica CCBAS932]|uniref:Uncharacterized protein n=1 Tax=Morchella conica CCBAS932 TaxID=1392247 RepID=A0A3N4KTF5_9PEZI|nr:hypothetical protein P167DRAFT_544182 [Morchella conica CCBAS932]